MSKKHPGINIDLNKLSSKAKIFVELPVSIDSNTEWRLSAKVGAYTYFRGGRVAGLKEIGRYCSVAPDVVIGDGEHPIDYLSSHPFQWEGSNVFRNDDEYKKYQGNSKKLNIKGKEKIMIGNDVWIGSGARILRGVKIGDGAIIAAGAVVAKDVEPYSIVGGVPAKHIKYRFEKDIVKRLLKIRWWDYTMSSISGVEFEDIGKAISELEKRKKEGLLKKFKPEEIIVSREDEEDEQSFFKKVLVQKPYKLIKGVGASFEDISRIDVKGSGHKIILGEGAILSNGVRIVIKGKNNTVEFGKGVKAREGSYVIKGDNKHIKIGDNTSIGNRIYFSAEDSSIEIGNDCMFSYDVSIITTDSHSIFDGDTGDRINYPKDIKIGNKVWLGTDVMVLKGVAVANGSIVGARSLVTKTLDKEKSIYAGSPAKFVKGNILWDYAIKNNINDKKNLRK